MCRGDASRSRTPARQCYTLYTRRAQDDQVSSLASLSASALETVQVLVSPNDCSAPIPAFCASLGHCGEKWKGSEAHLQTSDAQYGSLDYGETCGQDRQALDKGRLMEAHPGRARRSLSCSRSESRKR